MQMRIDAMKKMKKDLSLNNTNASAPRVWAKVGFGPLALGGVLGRKKLNKPRAREAMAAILKVNANSEGAILKTLSIRIPVRIQPIVPKTLMVENSLLGSFICLKATELASARVGAYINE